MNGGKLRVVDAMNGDEWGALDGEGLRGRQHPLVLTNHDIIAGSWGCVMLLNTNWRGR